MLVRDLRRARIVALAAVTSFAALLVALVLALEAGDFPTTASKQPGVQANQQPYDPYTSRYPVPAARQPAVDLRSVAPTPSVAGTVAQTAAQPGFGTRYEGGPEEGSRGATSSSAANPGRPDGGPEEGTRGPGH